MSQGPSGGGRSAHSLEDGSGKSSLVGTTWLAKVDTRLGFLGLSPFIIKFQTEANALHMERFSCFPKVSQGQIYSPPTPETVVKEKAFSFPLPGWLSKASPYWTPLIKIMNACMVRLAVVRFFVGLFPK